MYDALDYMFIWGYTSMFSNMNLRNLNTLHKCPISLNLTKSDLYFRYRTENVLTPYYCSRSSELCMNFVFEYCVMNLTNQKAWEF